MAEPYYTTVDMLRSMLGVSEAELGDDAALELIADAEDLIDDALGYREVDSVSGRAVLEADVEAWQWTLLERATLKLARELYGDPSIAEGWRARSVSGPDFSFTGLSGSRISAHVLGILRRSGLMRATGIASVSTSLYGDAWDRVRYGGVVGN